MSQIIIYITCPNKESAQAISRILIEKRFVACANILNGHEAYYWWEGKVQTASEVAVLFKTRKELFSKVEQEIKRLHPYDVPCIVSWEIRDGHAPFLSWIENETLNAVQ